MKHQDSPKPDDLPGATFRAIRKFMSEPDISYNAPWSDREWELYVNQEQLPPNQSAGLPVEEQLEITL